MKVISRKGVTIASLVITVIVLAIITGVIVSTTIGDDGIVEEVQNNISEQERRALIQTIAKEIQTEQLKKEISGTYTFNVVEDVIPILEKYGTYNNQTLKLTTEDGKEIMLYDMMQIPILEYATVIYEEEVLTIQTTLTGYTVEYTTNGGQSWNTYTEAVDVAEGSSLFARIQNNEGKVISNTIKIVEGTMQTEDTTAPIIRIVSQTNQGKTIDVTIYVVEYGELAEDNEYEYYLSTSNETQENGEWKQYTPGRTFTIGEDLEGTYYIHVKGVSDISGNTSDIQVSGAYVIEESTNGSVVLPNEPPTVSLSVNGNSNPRKSQSTTIQVETPGIALYNYGWSTSSQIPPTKWEVSISKVQEVTKAEGNANYYLWIKDLQDGYGNIAQSTQVGGIQVNLVSEAFNVETTAPTVTLTTNTNSTLAKSQSTTIKVTETNNVTYKYGWTNSNQVAPITWTLGTNKTQEVTKDTGDGNYYLWVKDLEDEAGNKGETIVVGGIAVNVVSGVFALDNTAPNEFTPQIAVKTENTIKVNASTTDSSGQAVTYKYSKDNGRTWQDSNTFTNLTVATRYENIQVKAIDSAGNETTSENILGSTGGPVNGSYVTSKGVNSPLLAEGMTAVYWNGTTEVTSENPTTDVNFDYTLWYNYEAQTGTTTNGGTSKWANAKTADGSYWVWIPRYAYCIKSGYHTSTAGTIDVEFLKNKTNTSTTGKTQYATGVGANNWLVHPAFYYDGTSTTGTQLAGIWVAKYEMSMEKNGVTTVTTESNGNVTTSSTIKAVSKPGVTAWRNIQIKNMFTNSLNYDTTSVSNSNLDSHLMKNMEYGAVVYLAHSKYGRNGSVISANSNASYYTGGANGATAHTNILQSTTGNCYGIFDLVGGGWEQVASYVSGTSASSSARS